MLKFPLYLDEASDKKHTAAAAKQQQNKAEEVKKMSKIPTQISTGPSRGIGKKYVFSSRSRSMPCW